MSHTWKFLPIAALVALGAFMLLPGVATHSPIAHAYDCGDDKNLVADFVDEDGDVITGINGFSINVDPDPYEGDGSGDLDVDDGDTSGVNQDYDGDQDGSIRLEGVCATEDAETYVVTASLFDEADDNCDFLGDDAEVSGGEEDVGDTFVEFSYSAGSTRTVTFFLECELPATPVPTVGPAQTVTLSSSQSKLGCGATSIVTVTVKDGAGKAVANGTLVNIVTDKGSVSPTSGQTTADGSVFVFYTAPNNTGGKATISAASGSALGTAEITIDCNTAPTQAPPPTSDVGSGGIQPPNTGDGGLATGNSWHTYAGIALILSSVIATLAVVRPRA